MKKVNQLIFKTVFVVVCFFLTAFTFNHSQHQAKFSATTGWEKIAEGSLDGKKSMIQIDLTGKAAKCAELKFVIKHTPANLIEAFLSYDFGSNQQVTLGKVFQPNTESKVVSLWTELATMEGTRAANIYMDQKGNCWCEGKSNKDFDDYICHKAGSSGGNCKGCETCGNEIIKPGVETASPRASSQTHRNLTSVKILYVPKSTQLSKTKNTVVEVWGNILK